MFQTEKKIRTKNIIKRFSAPPSFSSLYTQRSPDPTSISVIIFNMPGIALSDLSGCVVLAADALLLRDHDDDLQKPTVVAVVVVGKDQSALVGNIKGKTISRAYSVCRFSNRGG